MNYKKIINLTVYIAVPVFILRWLFAEPESLYDLWGVVGEVCLVTSLCIVVYDKLIWRFNSFEKVPKIFGSYVGTLEYTYGGIKKSKEIKVEITQTLFNVSIKLFTDEITSKSVSSTILNENGDYALLYTYKTLPKSSVADHNPIQYGTCRLDIRKNELTGIYWTSRKTTGDLTLHKKENLK